MIRGMKLTRIEMPLQSRSKDSKQIKWKEGKKVDKIEIKIKPRKLLTLQRISSTRTAKQKIVTKSISSVGNRINNNTSKLKNSPKIIIKYRN